MEGVEEDSQGLDLGVWVGADWAGGAGGRECGHLGHSACVGSGDTQVEVTSRHLEGPGESLGPPPTSLPNPSLSTEMEALCSALAVLGLRGVGAAFTCFPIYTA